MTASRPRRGRLISVGLLAALVGVLLFAYAVREAGIDEIRDGIGRVGLGFLLILFLSGVRETVRTLAWMMCIEGPVRLRFRDAFAARQTGEAMGNLTGLGLLISEPAKAIFVRRSVPVMTALAATSVENIFYSFTVIIVLAAGTVALLACFTLPEALHAAILWALGGIGALALAGVWVMMTRPRIASAAAAYMAGSRIAPASMPRRVEQVRVFEDRVYGFVARNRARLLPLAVLETIFHLSGVAESYVTLSLISPTHPPTWLEAFVLEAVNRFINVVFKVIPMRIGIEEVGTGFMTGVLGFGNAAGVTMGIVRKARLLVWTAYGLALLIKRGLSPRRVLDEAEGIVDQAE